MARYVNSRTGQYDGVHLYGNTGREDYTNSVKSILMMALPEINQPKSNSGVGTAQEDNHNNCAQAKHQKKRKYQPNVETRNRFNVFNPNMGNC